MLSPPLPAPLPPDPVRVGRLQPLPGVVPREHPDRAMLQRFLAEVQLPLAAMQSLLELATAAAPDAAAGPALRACAEHVEHVLALAADYRDCSTLETGQVQPAPAAVALLPWLSCTLAELAATGERLQVAMRVRHRSFVPDRVVLDARLAARAITAVLRVAMQRALPGPLDVFVAFEHDKREPTRSRLRLECQSRGGGFAEIDEGYVFTPFAVRDAETRPWLGLSVGQALCELLGGGLRVTSRGLGACSYSIALTAAPASDATWLDPLATADITFGPVG